MLTLSYSAYSKNHTEVSYNKTYKAIANLQMLLKNCIGILLIVGAAAGTSRGPPLLAVSAILKLTAKRLFTSAFTLAKRCSVLPVYREEQRYLVN